MDGFENDPVVEVGDVSFHLHKVLLFPLLCVYIYIYKFIT
jgi:hypothetical protein